MSYVKPSVLVYQDLLSSGGVANTTPDLETCIVGPAYNSQAYVPGSVASQVLTAAQSSTSTTGTVSAASYAVTVVSVAGFSSGDVVQLAGAGASGANLQGTITDITGNVITLDTAAGTSVTAALFSKVAKIVNATVNNTFSISNQAAGQIVDPASVQVWLSNAKIQTLVTGAEGYYTDNTLTIRSNNSSGVWSTGGISASGSTLTLTSGGGSGLVVGDSVVVTGAGVSGANLTTKITNIVGDVLTVTPAASTTVAGANVAKVVPVNLNSSTNTLRVEAGDAVVYSYVSNNSVAKTVTTAAKTVVTSAGQNGTLVSIDTIDALPLDISFTSHGGISASGNVLAVVTESAKTITAMSWAANVVTATSTAHGFNVGDTTTIAGVTPSGYNGVAVVTSVPTANTFTFALATNPGVVTVQGTATYGTNISGLAAGAKVVVFGAGAGGSDLLASVVSIASQNVTLDTAAGTTVAGAKFVVLNRTLNVTVRKTYNDQQMPSVKPISGGANFDTTVVATAGTVTINANSELSYGPVVTGDVYIAYSALRTDLVGRVLAINDVNDLEGQLGAVDDTNPLGLGVLLALANTTTRIRAITVASNDLAGYEAALTTAEGERLYTLVPLTQDPAIQAAFKAHVVQMSTPVNASWRVTLVNTPMPGQTYIGPYSPSLVNANGGNNAVTIIAGQYVLTASNATFISDGVAAGDVVYFTASSVNGQLGAHQVLQVLSNQQLVLQTTTLSTGNSYYVSRTMSKTQTAQAVAAASTVFNSNRVVNVQPDLVGVSINGVTKFLPGYYLACALGGMMAGFPVQQGFTNIGVAGIVDLKHSNFYFSRADMNAMAGAGTCLFAQESQGGIPYVRHELTTDMSTLEYREILVVKNWDFLSYAFHDVLRSFIGSWNITTDTLNTLRQTITAEGELLKGQKLPKIGAPLLSFTIQQLAQNAYNKDNVDAKVAVEVVYPLNYLNLHLII